MSHLAEKAVFIVSREEIESIPRIPKEFSLKCTEIAKKHLEREVQSGNKDRKN